MSTTNYSQDPRYALYRDLIGHQVWLKNKYSKKNLVFFPGGIVIDETYNTIIATHEENPKKYSESLKTYLKKNYMFRIELENKSEIITIEFDGKKILKTPENRLKMIRKKRRK